MYLNFPVTKEQLLSNSAASKLLTKQGKTLIAVYTTAEQNHRLRQGRTLLSVISDDEVFFFTDDYCMFTGALHIPNLVSSSTACPMRVAPRPELASGVITNAEEYIRVFEHDKRQITSVDELVTYLNSKYVHPSAL